MRERDRELRFEGGRERPNGFFQDTPRLGKLYIRLDMSKPENMEYGAIKEKLSIIFVFHV